MPWKVLTKALQEALTEINILKSRLDVLENTNGGTGGGSDY